MSTGNYGYCTVIEQLWCQTFTKKLHDTQNRVGCDGFDLEDGKTQLLLFSSALMNEHVIATVT